MRAQFSRIIFLVLVTLCVSVNMQNATNKTMPRRTTPRPGFVKTLFQVAYEQWTDTRNTLNKINKMLNDNFLPENAAVTTAPPTTESNDPNATTVKTPYRITRANFSRILRRNVKGLVRLFNLELDDALKQSRVTDKEFRKNATREFSKFL